MIEMSTTPAARAANDFAHAERAQAFAAFFSWLRHPMTAAH